MKINYKFLEPTDTMERITRAEFAANLDAVLDKVTKDDVGIVITEEGKKDLVLCPKYWFDYCFNDDFGCIVNSAVRYSLGRNPYMPSTVAAFVRKYMDILGTKTIHVMMKDILQALEDPKLDQREVWWSLYADLEAAVKEEP